MNSLGGKICCCCKQLKDKDRYHKSKNRKDGLHPQCKNCVSQRHKIRYDNNKDRISKVNKNWKDRNIERVKETNRKYTAKNKKRLNAYKKDWNKKNPNYYANYIKKRYQTDLNFQLRILLSARLKNALTREKIKKENRVCELLGCSIEEFKIYIESLFLPGMTWLNRGKAKDKWHIDHIRPCASFDLTKPEHQKQCFHYTNLQPLWSFDNISKGSIYNGKRYLKNKDTK